MNIKHTIAVLVCLFSILHASAQDFKVSKTDDNKVEITYNTKRNLKKVELYVSTNDGQDYQGPLTIKGDRYDIPKGKNKKIIWDPSVDNPRGYDGYFRFRLDRIREESAYPNKFYMMVNPSFISGNDNTCGGIGVTLGYMFRRFGTYLSLGGYFGGREPSPRYSGFMPEVNFQVGGFYKITPKYAIKAGIGLLTDESIHTYGAYNEVNVNPLGSIGFMFQHKHLLCSVDCVLTSESGNGFCGGMNFGIGYAF